VWSNLEFAVPARSAVGMASGHCQLALNRHDC
jgi:hypothetical protein